MFRSTVDGKWHQMEWYGTWWKLVEASTHMWNQIECDGNRWNTTEGREEMVTHYGHNESQSWHYPPVNVSSLVQRFWHLCDRGYGDNWDGRCWPDQYVPFCSGDEGFCSPSCYVPMSGIGSTALCSGSQGYCVSFCGTIRSAQVWVQTPDTKGPRWPRHLLGGCVGEDVHPWTDWWWYRGVGGYRCWQQQDGWRCHAWSNEYRWTRPSELLVAWPGFGICNVRFDTTVLLPPVWSHLQDGWLGRPGVWTIHGLGRRILPFMWIGGMDKGLGWLVEPSCECCIHDLGLPWAQGSQCCHQLVWKGQLLFPLLHRGLGTYTGFLQHFGCAPIQVLGAPLVEGLLGTAFVGWLQFEQPPRLWPSWVL